MAVLWVLPWQPPMATTDHDPCTEVVAESSSGGAGRVRQALRGCVGGSWVNTGAYYFGERHNECFRGQCPPQQVQLLIIKQWPPLCIRRSISRGVVR